MIKANELRIGNLVNVPREDQSPFRIDAFEYLSNTYIKVAMTHPEFGDKMHPLTWYGDDLSPIKQTYEWFLKFGFFIVETNGKFEATLPNFRYNIYWDKYTDGFLFCDGETVLINFNYVHELQNLVFVLGQRELTVA